MPGLDIFWHPLFQTLYVSLVIAFLFIKNYLENLANSYSVLLGAIILLLHQQQCNGI